MEFKHILRKLFYFLVTKKNILKPSKHWFLSETKHRLMKSQRPRALRLETNERSSCWWRAVSVAVSCLSGSCVQSSHSEHVCEHWGSDCWDTSFIRALSVSSSLPWFPCLCAAVNGFGTSDVFFRRIAKAWPALCLRSCRLHLRKTTWSRRTETTTLVPPTALIGLHVFFSFPHWPDGKRQWSFTGVINNNNSHQCPEFGGKQPPG